MASQPTPQRSADHECCGSPKFAGFSAAIVTRWLIERDQLRKKALPLVYIIAAADSLDDGDPAVHLRLEKIEMTVSSAQRAGGNQPR